MLNINSGRTRYTLIEGVGLEAAGNGEQHGIHVFARRGPGDDVSGMWHSDFKNCRVYNFGGAQMWLQGGGQDARDPVQFLTMQNVVLERRNDSARSIGLLMSGQVNQTMWLNGRIDGFGSRGDHPGVNVKICRQLDHYDPSTDGSTEYISDRSGHSHLFANVTFQQAQLGVYVDKAESITFDTCHFEGLDSGLLFSNAGQNRVDRSHFANSAVGRGEPFSIRAINGPWFQDRPTYSSAITGIWHRRTIAVRSSQCRTRWETPGRHPQPDQADRSGYRDRYRWGKHCGFECITYRGSGGDSQSVPWRESRLQGFRRFRILRSRWKHRLRGQPYTARDSCRRDADVGPIR